ncbi:hypothetical protein WOLCODRAFT_84520 [Wolfiporia cocos MD-104 SS10]|uniref:Uncharacterized protein n=1 Tax=Wolfiporia cocos (strain MD-104) TaxID=742152 RepID=A0A2H3JF89_WOLCO|nr:hypothetical protein WOLCODRAFT_84520 [Wolfiporia cocos MD-104 SS10]
MSHAIARTARAVRALRTATSTSSSRILPTHTLRNLHYTKALLNGKHALLPVFVGPRRCFTATHIRADPAIASFSEDERPDLYYHLFEPPTSVYSDIPVYALSFLSKPPANVQSATVIGWLPASADGSSDEAGLNDFVENARFREVLHEAIQSALKDGVDEIQKNGAIQTLQGWMHIHGKLSSGSSTPHNRNIPALGRIGDPDDIIASVRVEEGMIMPETYQPMPSYRFCTSDGVIQLTEGLAQRLREVLEARAAEEDSQAN